MINKKEIPFLLLLVFMLVYTFFGNPENTVWSGLYFLTTHLTLALLFKDSKDASIRRIGIALNISIIIYIAFKFFLNIEINRVYNIVPFTICVIGIVHYEKIKNKNIK